MNLIFLFQGFSEFDITLRKFTRFRRDFGHGDFS
jgi:hypothetical protein